MYVLHLSFDCFCCAIHFSLFKPPNRVKIIQCVSVTGVREGGRGPLTWERRTFQEGGDFIALLRG